MDHRYKPRCRGCGVIIVIIGEWEYKACECPWPTDEARAKE